MSSTASRPGTRRDPRHDVLFEPVRIGPKTLRNRFYQVPHCTGFGVHKPFSQAGHRGVKAEGGWAAVCTEFAPVAFDSDEAPYVPSQIVDDDDAACLAVVVESIHAHGSLAGIELAHSGGQASTQGSRWTPVAPSQISSDYVTFQVPKAMEAQTSGAYRATLGEGRSEPSRSASTSSTRTEEPDICPRSSSPPRSTSEPTATAAPSPTGRAFGWRRSNGCVRECDEARRSRGQNRHVARARP